MKYSIPFKNNVISRRGFTLLELSIILVVIGLIIGSIMAGKTLIQAAQVRATIAQLQQYDNAAGSFIAKYDCLPGDCAKATTFWTPKANCASGNGVLVTSYVGCDGNGDGKIATDAEKVRFWQHLSNARMIDEYMYASALDRGDSNTRADDDTTYPLAKMGMARFTVEYGPNRPDAPITLLSHIFILGGYPSEDYANLASVVTGAQAFGIDKKLDDGKPDTGNIFRYTGYNGDDTECATNDSPRLYAINGTSKCSVVIGASF